MSAPAMVRVVTLDEVIAEVEREVSSVALAAGSYSEDPANWHRRNRDEMAALGKRLEVSVAARINDRWDGCKVRIAGITSGSTSGLSGALANWLRSARAKASA